MNRERDTFTPFEPLDRGLFGDNELNHDDDKVTMVNPCDIDLFCHNDNVTKLAIAVSTDREAPFAKWIWLPRSLIKYVNTGSVRNCTTVRVTLPEKLAKDKGLV